MEERKGVEWQAEVSVSRRASGFPSHVTQSGPALNLFFYFGVVHLIIYYRD